MSRVDPLFAFPRMARKEIITKMKMIKMIASVLLFVIIFLYSESAAISSESIKLTTEDQKQIRATYYPSPSGQAPGIILIPDTRCDGSVFSRFSKKLSKEGFSVLAMDLRYKDLIATAGRPEAQIKLLLSQDVYAPVNYEIKSAMDFFTSQKEVDPERIVLLGTSYGSRVALHSGVKYKVKALALVSLSGDEALPGKGVKELLEEYGDRPILFMTSERDWGGNYKAAEHNKLYIDWARGRKELRIWPGSAHGVEILNTKEAADFTIKWLKGNL
jgi:dienelactone hydrolase